MNAAKASRPAQARDAGVTLQGNLSEALITGLAHSVRSRGEGLRIAILDRICAVACDASSAESDEYMAGLRATAVSAVDYALRGLEEGGDSGAPIPANVLAQARRAAQAGVSLETVLLRYTAGYGVLTEVIIAEAAAQEGSVLVLRAALRRGQSLFERVVETAAVEYRRESARLRRSDEDRRGILVRRLLAGGAVDATYLGYQPDGWHLGMIATGAEASEGIKWLGRLLDRKVLCEGRSEDSVWGWLGGARRLASIEIAKLWPVTANSDVWLAIGEPAQGITGFAKTHRQAQAAFGVALRRPNLVTLFSDVALEAAVLRDELMASSLEELYLVPLRRNGGDGTLDDTLRAYFACGCRASSAASVLGVNRRTVERRIRTVESRLGRPLSTCRTEMEVALRLDELKPAS
jgi:hypothetical protein